MGGTIRILRFKGVFVWLAVLAIPCALAQDVPTKSGKTYFLIDASDSMGDKLTDGSTPQFHADEILSSELKKFTGANPKALASINFYHATPKACDAGAATIKPQLPIPSPFPKSPKPSGATNLGAVLDAVLNDVGGSPATIVIISDSGQSERCGFHVCTVAEERLPGLSGITVQQYWTPAHDDSSVPFPCIQAALIPPVQVAAGAPDGGQNNAAGGQSQVGGQSGDDGRNAEWDAAGPGERWLWLIGFALAVLSALSFGVRWLLKALEHEHRVGEIQERQRWILTGQGDADEHRKEINTISELQKPDSRYIVWAMRVGIATAALSFAVYVILLFFDGTWFFNIQLDSARRLAWFVLGSNFSNTFAILGLAPMLTAGALYMRSLQARQNFALARNAAAEDEAKRRDAEVDSLFGYLESVRSSILKSTIDTPWAEAKSIGGIRRRTAKYDDQDRQRLEVVKKRLLEIAQGPAPERIGASKTSLAEQTIKLERYAPKQRWWERNWDLPSLIADLDRPTASPFKDEAADWRLLAESVRSGDVKQVKVSLKKLAEPKAAQS